MSRILCSTRQERLDDMTLKEVTLAIVQVIGNQFCLNLHCRIRRQGKQKCQIFVILEEKIRVSSLIYFYVASEIFDSAALFLMHLLIQSTLDSFSTPPASGKLKKDQKLNFL